MRRGPLREGAWRSPLRSERTATLLGMWVGVAFAVCFATGLLSHLIQNPPSWFGWPSRPVNLYRVTQGLHVISGFAAIPLLLAKLWTVYPKLFEWPPVRSLLHAIGRLSLLVLVGSAIFQLVTGVLNVARWYVVMPFFFTTAHYWTAWIAIGAILVHVGSKLAIIRIGLSEPAAAEPPAAAVAGGLTRRSFLTAVAATSGVVALTTAGQTVPALSGITVFGQRDPRLGLQGLPVNKSAASAGVLETAVDPTHRITLDGPRPQQLSLAVLRSLPQHTVRLPITCVEGWSATADWTGIRMADLLDMMGLPEDAEVTVESLQESGLYRASVLAPPHSRDPLTLLALRLNGADLHIDHGYPARLIAPNRPGVLQTKWVSRVRAL
ncbi:MAG: molybdopterin-dependent oxidoreductase [Geodermatophilaceae bacterium]|nr:molybdopterin-dependent oxidoreductase [Geodermatophilaceae bacterium]